MQIPMQITIHQGNQGNRGNRGNGRGGSGGVQLSEAQKRQVIEKFRQLEKYHPRITSCRVTVTVGVPRGEKGRRYSVQVDLTVPREELAVTRQYGRTLQIALREAFDAARRRLEDEARVVRGAVKTHATPPLGRVHELYPEDGYGFIEAADGRQLYFHRNSVVRRAFERLQVGSEVLFVEEDGDKGPQAKRVRVAESA